MGDGGVPAYLEVQDCQGYPQWKCLLCNRWATEGHVSGHEHIRKKQWQGHYAPHGVRPSQPGEGGGPAPPPAASPPPAPPPPAPQLQLTASAATPALPLKLMAATPAPDSHPGSSSSGLPGLPAPVSMEEVHQAIGAQLAPVLDVLNSLQEKVARMEEKVARMEEVVAQMDGPQSSKEEHQGPRGRGTTPPSSDGESAKRYPFQ